MHDPDGKLAQLKAKLEQGPPNTLETYIAKAVAKYGDDVEEVVREIERQLLLHGRDEVASEVNNRVHELYVQGLRRAADEEFD